MPAVVAPADQWAALALLAPWAAHADGPDAVLVEGTDGQAVTRALGQGGIWPFQVTAHRPAWSSRAPRAEPPPPGPWVRGAEMPHAPGALLEMGV